MQNMMFSGMFGALATEHRMNSIANNLANVHTTGFKRDLLAFKDTFQMYAHDQIMEPVASVRSEKLFPEPMHLARTRIATAQTDFSQGPLKGTGGPLDVAISGDGFFKIRTGEGDFYSRNGHFMLSSEGRLVTAQGYSVIGDGGEILVPAGTKNVVIAEDGRIFADDNMVGAISLVSVEDTTQLERYGNNLYRGKNGAAVAEGERGSSWMAQGFLEAPNVEVVYEMVNMIETQRQFEAYQKVMQTSDAVDKEAISRVGRARS